MNEHQIRQIIRDEINIQKFQTGKPDIYPHAHDDISSPKISQNNIIPGVKFNGTIDMAQSTVYTLPVTGNPTSITFYGGALNIVASPAMHAMIIGNAQLGSCYQFQTGTNNTSVSLNNIKTSIIQGSASFIMKNGAGGTGPGASSIVRNSEGHIVYADDANGNIYAMATVTTFNNSLVQVTTSLAPNWKISGLWIIT